MSKIDIGVGQEFPLDARERDERADYDDEYGCGHRGHRHRHHHHRYRGYGGHFFPRVIWIVGAVALIAFTIAHPFVLVILALGALAVGAHRHGLLREMAQDIREGWYGTAANTPAPPNSTPPVSNPSTNANPSTGLGPDAGAPSH